MPKRYYENLSHDLTLGQEIEIDHSLWKTRIKELIQAIISNENKRNRKVDGGLYVGIGGIAYMLWFVSEKIAEFNFLDTADQFAQLHLKFCAQIIAEGVNNSA